MGKTFKSKLPKGQKYAPGEFVRIAADLRDSMRHFPKDCYGMIEGTYAQLCWGDNVDSYQIWVEYSDGIWYTSAWYKTWQLTLVTDEETIKLLKKRFNGETNIIYK